MGRQMNIGILGGGQIGRMTAEAAITMGVKPLVWEPGSRCPASHVAEVIEKPWDDPAALDDFVGRVDAVTLEFENVPLWLVQEIEKRGKGLYPGSNVLAVAQDRWEEKQFFERTGIPYAPTKLLNQAIAYMGIIRKLEPNFHYPAIVKTMREGYDGKGQRLVNNNDQLLNAWIGFGRIRCVLEQVIPFAFELSVIIARDMFGRNVIYPLFVNQHREGILRRTVCPSPLITPSIEAQAKSIARRCAEVFGLVGVLTIELFAVKDQKTDEYQVIANEIAPRPHNSGHGTIEACEVSQYEQLVRIALGEPVRQPNLRQRFVMVNLIGDQIEAARRRPRPKAGVHFHDYGKVETRPGRKMGHVTCLTD